MAAEQTFTVWLEAERFNESDRRWYPAGWTTRDSVGAATSGEAVEKAIAAWVEKRPDRRFVLVDVALGGRAR